MAEKEALSVGDGHTTGAQSTQSVLTAAGSHSLLQDKLNHTPLDFSNDRIVQPFPRSPKLLKKIANTEQLSQVKTGVMGYIL